MHLCGLLIVGPTRCARVQQGAGWGFPVVLYQHPSRAVARVVTFTLLLLGTIDPQG